MPAVLSNQPSLRGSPVVPFLCGSPVMRHASPHSAQCFTKSFASPESFADVCNAMLKHCSFSSSRYVRVELEFQWAVSPLKGSGLSPLLILENGSSPEAGLFYRSLGSCVVFS